MVGDGDSADLRSPVGEEEGDLRHSGEGILMMGGGDTYDGTPCLTLGEASP